MRQVAAMEALHNAVKDGIIPEARVEASVRRIAHVKERFLHPYAPPDPAGVKQVVGSRAHKDLLDTILQTSERRLKAQV